MIAHALIGMRSQNVLANGNFANGITSWSAVSTPTTFEHVASGRAHVIADSNGDGMAQAVALTLGRKYRLSFDPQVESGTMSVTKVGMTTISGIVSGLGAQVLHFIESDGTSRNTLFQLGGAGEFYIDNIKLQRVF
jgi:Ca2+-binding RTX toxin-like protein